MRKRASEVSDQVRETNDQQGHEAQARGCHELVDQGPLLVAGTDLLVPDDADEEADVDDADDEREDRADHF